MAWPWQEAVLADRRCAQAAVRRLQVNEAEKSAKEALRAAAGVWWQ